VVVVGWMTGWYGWLVGVQKSWVEMFPFCRWLDLMIPQ
jgi:hypothetical protein